MRRITSPKTNKWWSGVKICGTGCKMKSNCWVRRRRNIMCRWETTRTPKRKLMKRLQRSRRRSSLQTSWITTIKYLNLCMKRTRLNSSLRVIRIKLNKLIWLHLPTRPRRWCNRLRWAILMIRLGRFSRMRCKPPKTTKVSSKTTMTRSHSSIKTTLAFWIKFKKVIRITPTSSKRRWRSFRRLLCSLARW